MMDDRPQPQAGEPVFRKEKGLRHLFAAARYSMQGVERLWQEAAFRHEVIAFAVGVVILVLVSAPFAHYLIFFVLMMLLFAVEALNTAIEEIVDRVSPEFSKVGRHAKDLGSLAVFCLLLANGSFALYAIAVNLFF
jgi:diacylglycerol kinase (ATP)